ncbi:MAG: Ig-like domain-containing protein [Pseudomonadota bacterium]|nr:Ig-like domain-containing protein [Pseudomonadota bacterium]
MHRKHLVLAVGLALLSPVPVAPVLAQPAVEQVAAAQQAGAAETNDGSIPLTLVSSNARVGLGVNEQGDLHGEARGYFADDGDSIWFGEGWLGDGGAGGLKFGLNWLWGGATRADSIERPESVTVAKSFIAVDQNANEARKVSIGVGMERESWYGDVYVAGGITGEKQVGASTNTTVSTLTGTDAGRPYTQTQTIETLLRAFEHPYETGIGARIGRYFDPYLLRLSGGLDYELGKFDSSQVTVSGGLEKYFYNSGHSLALNIEHLEKDGDFEIVNNDTRAWLTWRYEFGQRKSFRAVAPQRLVEVKREVTSGTSAGNSGPTLIKNEIGMDANAFFAFDRALITAEGEGALAALIEAIKSGKRVSRISIVGHTCDIGSERYNQGLSERRAASVRDWFAAHGVDAAELDVSGKGETDPRFANDAAGRPKNRRVDVSFLTIEEKMGDATAPPKTETIVEWVKEPVAAPSAWIERALRNPGEHKRTVDVYRFETSESTTTLGPRVFTNRGPVAQNDSVSTAFGTAVVIAVLANDSDPDGDTLSISAVGAAQNGAATISGNNISYQPGVGFVGTDSFAYTISDGHGGTATATVTVTISGRPPVANPDVATTLTGIPVTIPVLANDTDPDGDLLSVSALSTAANGTLVLNANASVTYTPTAGFVGNDSFTYTLRDATGATAIGTVNVTVTPANRAPDAVDDSYMVMRGNLLTLELLANDSDPDGDPISIVSVNQPSNGVVITGTGGQLYYQGRSGFEGTDYFSYTITDTRGLTDTATVTVMIGD